MYRHSALSRAAHKTAMTVLRIFKEKKQQVAALIRSSSLAKYAYVPASASNVLRYVA